MKIAGKLARFLFACLVPLYVAGCEKDLLFVNDLELAREAYVERNLPLTERLLERYLREEQSPEKRWQAWNLLLKAINADRPHPRASLECLDAMMIEYEDDASRMVEILPEVASYNKMFRHFEQAAEAWNAWLELPVLDFNQRVYGLRQLAAMQFAQKHYEASQATLQQCLALPVPDNEKNVCLLDLAEEAMLREAWEEVADLCQQILETKPEKDIFGKASYLAGDALEQLGKKQEALAHFEQALDSYPNRLVIENRLEHLKKNNSK